MPEIAVTDEQRERLEQVRRDVEGAFVDTYGHARLEDAVEYLLDTYTPPDEERESSAAYHRIATADYPALQRIASNAPEVPGSGIEADEMRGKLLAALGPEKFAAELEAIDGDETPDATAPGGGDSEAASATEPAVGNEAESGDNTPAGRDDGDETSSNDTATTPLTAANRLLDEHDDKWRETDGDVPYEVDLPDGSTESARTRDDVRRLLFQHY